MYFTYWGAAPDSRWGMVTRKRMWPSGNLSEELSYTRHYAEAARINTDILAWVASLLLLFILLLPSSSMRSPPA